MVGTSIFRGVFIIKAFAITIATGRNHLSNKSITDTSHQNGKPTSWYKSSVGEHNPADQVLQVGKNCETDETNLSRVRDYVDGGDDDDDDGGDGYSNDDGGDGDGGPIQVGRNCETDETNLRRRMKSVITMMITIMTRLMKMMTS